MSSFGNYLVAFVLLLAALPVRARLSKQLLLLAASYVFYATLGTGFLAVLILSSLLNFGLGELLRRRPTLGRLWIGIAANISLLSLFKYVPVLAPALSSSPAADFLHRIVMPAGMSFWTFQALSYLFDLYHEEEIDPSLWEFCLYMAFWPTVLMGPVCRLPNLLPQFRELPRPTSADVATGVRRIGTGLLMKLVLAQLFSVTLNAGAASASGFDDLTRKWGGLDVWFLAVGFGFQLFFDFAGYSNIVIGAARLFGFRLEENFDSPYLASTPSIFWTRWHMSLSSWIRDYVFVPLATLRRDVWCRYLALLLSMVLFGLWHGPKITFVLWGAYHGAFLVLHRSVQQLQRTSGSYNVNGRLGGILSWAITFLGISLGWVFFRANDLNQAFSMVQAVFLPNTYASMTLPGSYYCLVLVLVSGYLTYSALLRTDYFKRKGESIFLGKTPKLGAAGEFLEFCWENRSWCISGTIAVVSVFAGLIVLLQTSQVAPFIYTLF